MSQSSRMEGHWDIAGDAQDVLPGRCKNIAGYDQTPEDARHVGKLPGMRKTYCRVRARTLPGTSWSSRTWTGGFAGYVQKHCRVCQGLQMPTSCRVMHRPIAGYIGKFGTRAGVFAGSVEDIAGYVSMAEDTVFGVIAG